MGECGISMFQRYAEFEGVDEQLRRTLRFLSIPFTFKSSIRFNRIVIEVKLVVKIEAKAEVVMTCAV